MPITHYIFIKFYGFPYIQLFQEIQDYRERTPLKVSINWEDFNQSKINDLRNGKTMRHVTC